MPPKLPTGFVPNGPGAPRSVSTYCTVAVTDWPPVACQPSCALPCDRRLSSLVTVVPSAGAMLVKPSSC